MVLLTRALLILTALTSLATSARADVLFEGYSKVLLGGNHIGYTVSRYEFDPKKQEFISLYYLKTNALGGNVTESLKARSNAKLKPISYQYTTLIDTKIKTIDATFKGDEMTAVVKDTAGGKTKSTTLHQKLPKDAFLSTFLGYLMLQGKEGMKPGVNYSYTAIAEEDGTVSKGEAFIKAQQNYNGIDTFKVLNTFKGEEFFSYVTAKGEVISTQSPTKKLSTELEPDVKQATLAMPFNSSSVEFLFGSVPAGKDNVVAKNAASGVNSAGSAPLGVSATGDASSAAGVPHKTNTTINGAPSTGAHDSSTTSGPGDEVDTPKKQGVPPGKGLILKPTEQKSQPNSQPNSQ